MKRKIGIILCSVLVAICTFALADVKINEKNFPDSVFREYIQQFDTDGNRKLSDEEISAVKKIGNYSTDWHALTSVKGIEFFSSLEQLYLSGSLLQTLDISKNKALEQLEFSGCQLQTLDISKNEALTYLDCSSNDRIQLITGDHPPLETLYCCFCNLTSLDVSRFPELKFFNCQYNKLTSLDISQNSKLSVLYCDNNELTELLLNERVERLSCYANQLKTLDIRNSPYLIKIIQKFEPETTYEYIIFGKGCDWIAVDPAVEIITVKLVTQISLNKAKVSVTRTADDLNPTIKLTATITPADATDPSVKWSSSNPKVATVNQKGKVTILKKGGAIIYCTAKDGSGIKASCKISVKNKLVTKITLNRKTATLKKGKKLQLKVKTVNPRDAVNQNVKWTTSNKKVATVDKNGKVTAKGKGTCIITCTAKDGSGVKVKCVITVE